MSNTVEGFEHSSPPLARSAGRRIRWALTFGLAGLAFGLLVWSGSLDGTNATLVAMGFDPDRATLIAALIAGGLVGAVATFAVGLRLPAAIAAGVAQVALYTPTFVTETRNALHSTADQGTFSLSGWLLTIVAIVTVGLVVAWAGPTLALDARRATIGAAQVAAAAARRRTARELPAWRPAAAVVLLVALVAGLPAFGTLVNYAPDSLMLSGHPPIAPLAGGDSGSAPGSAGGSGVAGGSVGAGGATSSANAGTTSTAARPWLGHLPTGAGTIESLTFPAPWTGGQSSANVWVYLPPGYSTSSTLRYDVIYEVPWTLQSWVNGTGMPTMLDSLIDSGRMAPTIVVYVSELGGPYVDTECIDSYDGRDRFESYVVGTVVPAIDAHYRTIATPAARTIFGFSQGGFCSSMLLLRHPDVFGNAVSMNGYYHAAPNAGQAATARIPFGGNASLIASHSPVLLAPTLPAAAAQKLYFVLVGSETAPFYGPEMTGFLRLLRAGGYGTAALATNEGHSWVEVRHELPATLDALFAHLVQAGVYRGVYAS